MPNICIKNTHTTIHAYTGTYIYSLHNRLLYFTLSFIEISETDLLRLRLKLCNTDLNMYINDTTRATSSF